MDIDKALDEVEAAREHARDAQEQLEQAIIKARTQADGSLREIAQAAGMNHEKVRMILQSRGVATA